MTMMQTQLYIPYGSNKTGQKFQLADPNLAFISHMVQIKLVTEKASGTGQFVLYIPYGSNKTDSELKRYPDDYFTFISHMVQIKRGLPVQKTARFHSLYPIWFK